MAAWRDQFPTQPSHTFPSSDFGPGLSALHTDIKIHASLTVGALIDTSERRAAHASLLIDATLADAADNNNVDVANDAAIDDKQPILYESWHVLGSKQHKYFGFSSENTKKIRVGHTLYARAEILIIIMNVSSIYIKIFK